MDRPGHDAAARGVQMPRCSRHISNNISRWNQAFAGARITAAISPVWLEKPERIAVLAMLTVRITRLCSHPTASSAHLRDHERHLLGNKGPTATPTTQPWCLPLTPVTLVHFTVDNAPMLHVHGVQEDHRIVCEAGD